jgi:AcrR family transcriptional regulator
VAAVKRRGRPPRAQAPTRSVEQRILDSACHLFYEEGLHAVGIDRVLSEAKAAKASLYDHYASKDELVAAYLAQRAGEWQARVDERVKPGDGRAGLLTLFGMLEEWANSPEFRGCPFLNAASELPDPAHPARAVTRRQREWLHGLIQRLVTAAGARDAERVGRAIVVLYDGAVASAVLDADPAAAKAARFAAERLLDAACSPPPTPHRPGSRARR